MCLPPFEIGSCATLHPISTLACRKGYPHIRRGSWTLDELGLLPQHIATRFHLLCLPGQTAGIERRLIAVTQHRRARRMLAAGERIMLHNKAHITAILAVIFCLPTQQLTEARSLSAYNSNICTDRLFWFMAITSRSELEYWHYGKLQYASLSNVMSKMCCTCASSSISIFT